MGHGTQKLFGWFGGPGLDNTAGMMESLEPASRAAAGAMLTGTMATVVRTVHLDRTGRRG